MYSAARPASAFQTYETCPTHMNDAEDSDDQEESYVQDEEKVAKIKGGPKFY